MRNYGSKILFYANFSTKKKSIMCGWAVGGREEGKSIKVQMQLKLYWDIIFLFNYLHGWLRWEIEESFTFQFFKIATFVGWYRQMIEP